MVAFAGADFDRHIYRADIYNPISRAACVSLPLDDGHDLPRTYALSSLIVHSPFGSLMTL